MTLRLQNPGGNDEALDFAGAFVDFGHAAVVIVALDGIFAAVALPPWIWMASWVTRVAISLAKSLAMAASMPNNRSKITTSVTYVTREPDIC